MKSHLLAFENHLKTPLLLNGIDSITLEKLQVYFFNQRNLNTQSTEKYLGLLKIFLNWAYRYKYVPNDDFKNFKSIKQPDSLKVIITQRELDKIESLDLKEKSYLENVRELFILSCLTGLRYSDYSRINKQHIKEDEGNDKVLLIRQQKTNEIIEIPLTNRAVLITDKIVSGKVHAISNQKMNMYVKELCKLAEIDELFEVFKFIGKNKSVELKPKYELITTHTGRRTFATNLLAKGVPSEVVMNFTGHRDYRSFSKYVNIPKSAQKSVIREAMIGFSNLKVNRN